MITAFYPRALVTISNSHLIIFPVEFEYKSFYKWLPDSDLLAENVRIKEGREFEMDYYIYKYVSLDTGWFKSDFESSYSYYKERNSRFVRFLNEFPDDQREFVETNILKSKVFYKLPWVLGFLTLFKNKKWFNKIVKSEKLYCGIHKEFLNQNLFDYFIRIKKEKKSYKCDLYNYSIRIDYSRLKNLFLNGEV